ncbi:hypothetical protein G5V59_02910 [Nocardioides sp. W3-2-3]|uniref:hypothetical protein n=1 Tax=Nocardioides convexus TaxID=2712224 RepID=UPI0024186286|nr:hypothetical protein [Nocardioides convexus]NGZ99690.1 hypothetical protein [Nocardioides convexus]
MSRTKSIAREPGPVGRRRPRRAVPALPARRLAVQRDATGLPVRLHEPVVRRGGARHRAPGPGERACASATSSACRAPSTAGSPTASWPSPARRTAMHA